MEYWSKITSVLEAFNKINTIVFDKTGTLTEGSLKIKEEHYLNGITKNEALQIIGSIENGSTHPIAKAISEVVSSNNITLLDVKNFTNVAGKGISGKINSDEILVGNLKLIEQYNIECSNTEKEIIDSVSSNGNTLLILVVNRKISAVLGAKDTVKESAKTMIKNAKSKKIELVMLTGDSANSANEIASQLGIDRVISNVLPTEKAAVIEKLKTNGKLVAMVGDGINDAPSLATADIGISISTASDIAINSADVVLMQDDLNKINTLYDISKKTIKIVKENLFWAFLYNICLIPIALGLLSSINIVINPMIASFAMMFSSLSVILNALRLR